MYAVDLSYDAKSGQFFRNLGKPKIKFYLGKDAIKAGLIKGKLETLWNRLFAYGACWDDWSRDLAQSIRRGLPTHKPERSGIWAEPESYAHLIERLQAFADLIPIERDEQTYSAGSAEMKQRYEQAFEQVRIGYPLPSGLDPYDPAETLHKAFDGYIASINPKASDFDKIKMHQAERLKEHHPDMPLGQIDLDEIERMLAVWTARPNKKNSTEKMAVLTCRNQITELKRFFQWLERSKLFSWKRPSGYIDLRAKVKTTVAEKNAKMTSKQVETYTIDELGEIWKDASPRMRLLMCLALNCGFIQSESGHLSMNCIQGDYIRYLRPKTGVYGQWRLWDITKRYIEIEKAKRPVNDSDLLFITRSGKSLIALTKSGNKSGKVASSWNHVIKWVRKRLPSFRKLPFKNLRKTGTNMIRQIADGEISKIYASHGKPTSDDQLEVYANKPFDKLDSALNVMESQLIAVFKD